jgi:hypothetical protein
MPVLLLSLIGWLLCGLLSYGWIIAAGRALAGINTKMMFAYAVASFIAGVLVWPDIFLAGYHRHGWRLY